jgi:hypothetical protein
MIGKPLSERLAVAALDDGRAVAALEGLLASQGAPLVEVRSKGPGMVACLVANADQAAARLCKSLGFRIRRGATCVFGLAGADAARLFPLLGPEQRAFLEAPARARETKIVLVAGGLAVLSVDIEAGRAAITAVPFPSPPARASTS